MRIDGKERGGVAMAETRAKDGQEEIPGTRRTPGRIIRDSELSAINGICKQLDALPEASRVRALRYIRERYAADLSSGERE